MNELEDTPCEIRRTVDLQFVTLDQHNGFFEENALSPAPSGGTNIRGNFLGNGEYAWLSCRSRLTVFSTKTGASISSWMFKDRVTCVTEFPSLPGQIPLLLVGLDNDAARLRDSVGTVCVFDCTISQVLRAIRVPTGVEQLCIINGGAEWEEPSDKRVDTVLVETSGMACVALRNLDHIMIDLRRSSWENFNNFCSYDEGSPAEIDLSDLGSTLRQRNNRERHAVHNLMSKRVERYLGFDREEFEASVLPQETLTTAMICSRKIGCLVSGCLGRVVVWQSDGIVRWISPQIEANVFVSNIALLEPTDDPRPFCYLWCTYQEDTYATSPVLRMYAMLFERKYSYKGTNQYFNLEGEPSLKFEMELDEGTRVASLCPIIRDSNQEVTEAGNKRGEDSLLLISTEESMYLFDLNQWYKEQMPRTVAECQNIAAILSSYQTKSELSENTVVSCMYVPSTLKEFPSAGQGSPEEFFFPNSLSLEWIKLSASRVTTWVTRGVQAQLLREMAMLGPVAMIHPAEIFHRCVALGLIPLGGDSSSNLDPDAQREMLLTLCLEQRWTRFLLKCVKEWSDGSAAFLFPAFIRWGVQRASTIKLMAHQLCIPLFDQSGCSIGEAEVKMLRSFCQQMECLSSVVENLSGEIVEVEQQQRTLKRITVYLQVLLWFYDVGLLPETQEVDEETLPISIVLRIPYPVDRLRTIYQEKREKCRAEGTRKEAQERNLFVDELISRECSALTEQWEREGTDSNSDGHYPPPSLQSLLRSILTDCHHDDINEMENKHQIIIYLLMDLVMLLQSSCPSVEQLVKYPAAFKLSPSLIKLTQALWLLDQQDYQGFLEIMTGQLVCDSDVKDWHHKLIIRTLIRSNQNKLALIYLRLRKPPLSSLEEQGTVITLSVEHGLVQSAFHRRPPTHYAQLLTGFFRACKANGRLHDILHLAMNTEEEEAFVQFLEEEKCDETRLLYYLQRCRYNEASSVNPSQGKAVVRDRSTSLAVFNAYNVTLPEVTRKFTSNLARKNVQIDPDARYPRPLSHVNNRSRICDIHEAVVRKAKETFSRGDRLQIPFITAPAVSLKSSVNSTDANCVMFVERARKPYGKRTLDEMRECESQSSVPRKRRRTGDESEVGDEQMKQLSLSMIFDTPLIKRKNQLVNSQNPPTETPHSILKIRRMIQDSMSPSASSSRPSPAEEERERRPRQIRFSINQHRIDDSLSESAQSGGDTTKSLSPSKGDSVENEEDYLSPDENGRFAQTTVLSENSHLTMPISGPRPRPSLRRSVLNDAPNDLLRKSLRNSMLMPGDTSLDSSRLSLDNSMTDLVSSTFLNSSTPKTIFSQLHATTVLSSSSDYELSPRKSSPPKLENNGVGSQFFDSSANESFSAMQVEEANTSITAIDSVVTSKTTVTRKTIIREEIEAGTNSETTEVSDNSHPRPEFEVEKRYNSTDIEEKLAKESKKDQLKQSVDKSTNSAEWLERRSQENEEREEMGEDEEVETVNPADDYDAELMALKYEDDEDNDEVFKSLTSSIDTENKSAITVKDVAPAESSTKKTAATRFYEEFNITDDESSRSIDSSAFTYKKQEVTPSVDSRASTHVRPDSVNITDDESDRETDVEAPKFSDIDRNMNERSQVTHEVDTFSDKVADRETPKTPTRKSKDLHPNDEQLTPRRVTRSQRASSVVPARQESASETPEAPRTPRTRRATSLVQELLSPAKGISSSSESPATTPSKRARGKRATSLMKEVLTSSATEAAELPVRRSARRAVSVQKDVAEISQTPPKSSKTAEGSTENTEEVKKPSRGARRPASVNEEINVTPRKTRGASTAKATRHIEEAKMQSEVSKAEDDKSQEVKPNSRTGLGSVRKGSPEVPAVSSQRRRQVASVVKDTGDSVQTRGKRGRTSSVSSDTAENLTETTPPVQRNRAGSIVQETTAEPVRRTRRAASVTKETEDTEKPAKKTHEGKRTRKASSSSEAENAPRENPPARRTRAVSTSQESEETPKKRRAGSVAKDEESLARRTTRASSLSKNVSEEESIPTRTRRRGSVPKELPSEPLRSGRASSLVRDIIPEESDEAIESKHTTRNTSWVNEEATESLSSTRGRIASIHAIPEENEEMESSGVANRRKMGRERRAMSVDLRANEDIEKKSERRVAVRRKRAASETKETGTTVQRPRRGKKLSQSNDSKDSYQFAAPEEARGAPTERLTVPVETDFVFSPPVSRSSNSTSVQDRREIVNFIPPLTEEERKMIPLKSKISKIEDVKRVNTVPHVPGYRRKFVLPKWSRGTSK